jgi:2-oxoglutarate ferredoxin oxidoreductase subunit alpha
MALHGRHSQSPVPVLAPCTPGDCFHIMLEAFHLSVKYMTPVVVLSDSNLANSAEPWLIPSIEALPRHPVTFATAATATAATATAATATAATATAASATADAEADVSADANADFEPYLRDPETLARPWAIPGTAGLEHRIGGLTKAPVTGDVVYDPESHAEMVSLRQQKIAGIAREYPPIEVNGPDRGELLVLGWGSTFGPITAAVKAARERGFDVSHVHLRHLNPFPSDLGRVLSRFRRILLPELNQGQLALLLRAEHLLPIESFTKIAGQPFKIKELQDRIEAILGGEGS